MADFRITYDDQLDDVVNVISRVLREKHGLKLVWDGKDADGYMDYNIVKDVPG